MNMAELEKVLVSLVPMLSAIAAIAAAVAAFKANEISSSLRRLQRNSILNQQEIQLLSRILELLKIYDVWCRDDGAGSDLNFHNSKESNYDSRDDASSQIPRDIKYILVQISSHSESLEYLLNKWEEDFVIKVGNSYELREDMIKEKIKSLRSIIAGGI